MLTHHPGSLFAGSVQAHIYYHITFYIWMYTLGIFVMAASFIAAAFVQLRGAIGVQEFLAAILSGSVACYIIVFYEPTISYNTVNTPSGPEQVKPRVLAIDTFEFGSSDHDKISDSSKQATNMRNSSDANNSATHSHDQGIVTTVAHGVRMVWKSLFSEFEDDPPTTLQPHQSTTTKHCVNVKPDEKKKDTTPNCCSICLFNLQVGDTVSQSRACQHAFHEECLSRWLSRSTSCPYCRHDMEVSTKMQSSIHTS